MTIRSNAVAQPELTVNLKGDGVDAETPTISVPRRTLDLGQVSPGGRATASLVVTNTSQVPLTVESAVTGGGYTLETPGPLVLTPGEQHATVIVAFSNATAGAFVGTLTLASNDPNQPSLDIALVVAVVEPPNVDDAIGPRPFLTAESVVNAATFQPGMTAGSWVAIFGENLARSTRTWDGAIIGVQLPTELDGVVVLINGRRAAIFFISPGQLNVQVPDDMAKGLIDVQVVVDGIPSVPIEMELSDVAPSFFMFDPEGRRYLAALHLDGTFIGKVGLFGDALESRPVRPSERAVLFGTGFGATDPPTPAGVIPNVAALAADVQISIGGLDAIVEFAGISGAGLYQFNVIIPAALTAGDAEVIATIGGVSSPLGTFLTIAE